MTNMEKVQTVVIGAGVIGLACARRLAEKGHEVLILERATSIGAGISSRNSEVIHAGIYYPPSSLKAKFCVEGRKMMYQYCSSRGIEVKRCGKLVVATNPDQKKNELKQIYQRGINNGVDDLRLLSSDDVKTIEPHVTCYGALLSPSTGLVDSHSFMVSLLGDAEANGAILVLQSTVKRIEFVNGSSLKSERLRVETDAIQLYCENVVNAAGLFSAELSQHNQSIDNQGEIPRHFFAKGSYFRLEGEPSPFTSLIYPVPEPGGLGIHATTDLSGQCKFGPDVEWISPDVIHADDIDLNVHPERCDAFYAEVRKYWPHLKDGVLIPDYSGVRPKLLHPILNGGTLFQDFVIQTPYQHSIHGLVNLLGIESPGLTSSMAIADYVETSLI